MLQTRSSMEMCHRRARRQLLRHLRRAYNLHSCWQAFPTDQPTFSAVTVPVQHSDTSRRSSNRFVTAIDTAYCVKTELNSWTGPSLWGVSGRWYARAAWSTPLSFIRPSNWCQSNYRTRPAHRRRLKLFFSKGQEPHRLKKFATPWRYSRERQRDYGTALHFT